MSIASSQKTHKGLICLFLTAKRAFHIQILLFFSALAVLPICIINNTYAVQSEPEPVKLFELENAPPLKNRQGYMLLDLDIGNASASIQFSQLRSKSYQQYLSSGERVIRLRQEFKLNFEDSQNGLFLLPLNPGVYQITQVNVPYYDLPFWVDTKNRRVWRFNIEKGKLNYIGKLSIARERKTDSVDVRLLNRYATDLERITKHIAMFQGQFPLVLSRGVQDDFDQFLQEAQ